MPSNDPRPPRPGGPAGPIPPRGPVAPPGSPNAPRPPGPPPAGRGPVPPPPARTPGTVPGGHRPPTAGPAGAPPMRPITSPAAAPPPRTPPPQPPPRPSPPTGVAEPTTAFELPGTKRTSRLRDPFGRKNSGEPRTPEPGTRVAPPPLAGPPPESTGEVPKPGFLRSRRGALLRWAALCLGLILIGWSLGYLVMPRSGAGEQVSIPKEAFEATALRGDMPSLVGLNRDAAVAAIGDAGISGVDIDYREKQAAGPVGTVVDQTPSSGIPVTGAITLTLSVPVSMPSLKGMPNRDARTRLEDLGAIVTVQSVVDPAVPAGSVIRTDPAEGQPMPASVIMVVADPGDALSLSTVSSVSSSSCSTSSSSSVAGKTLSNNVTCSPGSSKKASAEYAVNRNATTFEATVGTDDKAGTGGATVTIYGDGRPLKTVKVGLGKSEDIRVDLRNVMRLSLTVTSDGGDDSPTAVLGDARLRGSTDGLDQIAGRR